MSYPTDSIEEFICWFILMVSIVTLLTLGAFGLADIFWVLSQLIPR